MVYTRERVYETLSMCSALLKKQRCGTVPIFYGSGSGSDFWKVMVPVPVPYLDHKNKIFQKDFWNFFCLFTYYAVLQGKSL